MKRAGSAAEWSDAAIVHVMSDEAIETTAWVRFQEVFYPALLRGETSGDAFDGALTYLDNDPVVGRFSVGADKRAPSEKLSINDAGRHVCLSDAPASAQVTESEPALRPRAFTAIRRVSDRFVGRRREMAQIIDAVLPRPPGIRRGPEEGERRLVTITKEGGIGKTALAAEVADWAAERATFAGGVVELACEELPTPGQMLSRLLTLLGVPTDFQRGDLLALLAESVRAQFSDLPGLIVLDNLDDLAGNQTPASVREETRKILETLLTAAPQIRVLATCRWPVALAHHEWPVELPPLAEDEARDVFVSHLESTAHRVESIQTWSEPDSPVRQLIRMSGRHPQSLRLLARQMGRPGMTLARLRDEAHADLIGVLKDPLAPDDDTNRELKVSMSYERSYRHLSDPGKRLFERLSWLPGGIWCGDIADKIDWEALLGPDWRTLIERELDYFALVHYEPDRTGSIGTFRMLHPMLKFAREKYHDTEHEDWETRWTQFWRNLLAQWNQLISGRLPDSAAGPDAARSAAGTALQQISKLFLERTQANWLAVHEHLVSSSPSQASSLLLVVAPFCRLTGQLRLLSDLARRTVGKLRGGPEADLAASLGMLGSVLRDLGERSPARTVLLESLAIYRRLAHTCPVAFEPNLATTLNNLGNALHDLGEHALARSALEEALTIRQRLAQTNPAAFAPDVAMTLNNLGVLLDKLGQRATARKAFEEALTICRLLTNPVAFEPNVATTLNNLGALLSELGQRAAGRKAFEEALTIRRRLSEANPAAFAPDVAATLNNLGNLLLTEFGERAPARKAFEEALAIYRHLAQTSPAAFEPDVAMTLNNLGALLLVIGDAPSALTVLEEALLIYRRLAYVHPTAFAPDVAGTLNNLGELLSQLDDNPAARAAVTESVQLFHALAADFPAAFDQNFRLALRNYSRIVPETESDHWWQRWRRLNAGTTEAEPP